MKNTKLVAALLWFISLETISSNVFSQNTSSMHFPKVTFGEVDSKITTKTKLLANPKLICHEPDCGVVGFTFLIFRKDRNIIGPYHINGAQLTEKLETTLKNLPDFRTSIYIDSIEIHYQGKNMQVTGISFQYDH